MQRFTFLSHEGVALPDDAPFTDVGAIRVNATGLLVAPFLANDGKPATYKDAQKAAAAIQLFGQPCRLPEVEEAFLIPDRTKVNPAIDPKYFPFLADPSTWWMWTNTACAWNSAGAWYVSLGYGGSYVYSQYDLGLVLAVSGPVSSPGQ